MCTFTTQYLRIQGHLWTINRMVNSNPGPPIDRSAYQIIHLIVHVDGIPSSNESMEHT